MKLVRIAPLLVIALAPSIPRPTGACSLEPRDGGVWQFLPDARDTRGPTRLTASLYSIDRPADSHAALACGDACGPGPATVTMQITSNDDFAALSDIGYRFEVVGGEPPRRLDVSQTLRPRDDAGASMIGLTFDRESGPFSFDLRITAIDPSGNESEPIVLRIED